MRTLPGEIHAAIHAAFLAKGGSPEQWSRVDAEPRKFNRAWRRLLDLPDDTKPPPLAWRVIDPRTGKPLRHP